MPPLQNDPKTNGSDIFPLSYEVLRFRLITRLDVDDPDCAGKLCGEDGLHLHSFKFQNGVALWELLVWGRESTARDIPGGSGRPRRRLLRPISQA